MMESLSYVDVIVTLSAAAGFHIEIAEAEADTPPPRSSDGPHADASVRISVRITGALDCAAGSVQFPSAP